MEGRSLQALPRPTPHLRPPRTPHRLTSPPPPDPPARPVEAPASSRPHTAFKAPLMTLPNRPRRHACLGLRPVGTRAPSAAGPPPPPTSSGPHRSLLLAALRRHWGHAEFRPGQGEAIDAFFAGRDVLAVLPTGMGKSVIYLVPPAAAAALDDSGPGALDLAATPRAPRRLVAVVVPLLALADDAARGAHAAGLDVASLDMRTPPLARERLLGALGSPEGPGIHALFITPEALCGSDGLVGEDPEGDEAPGPDGGAPRRAREPPAAAAALAAAAAAGNLLGIAVDEAHCVVAWGGSFRPAYGGLGRARKWIERRAGAGVRVPLLALTATAPAATRRDICAGLGIVLPGAAGAGPGGPDGRARASGLIVVAPNRRPELDWRTIWVTEEKRARGASAPAPARGSFADAAAADARLPPLLRLVRAALGRRAWADERPAWWEDDGDGPGPVADAPPALTHETPPGVILYARRRDETERVARLLGRFGVWCRAFHAGLGESVRAAAAAGLRSGDGAPVVVATVAFGMGVDLPGVRRRAVVGDDRGRGAPADYIDASLRPSPIIEVGRRSPTRVARSTPTPPSADSPRRALGRALVDGGTGAGGRASRARRPHGRVRTALHGRIVAGGDAAGGAERRDGPGRRR